MANPYELYYGTDLLFRFYYPTQMDFSMVKDGASPMGIPTFIRPWMFDFTNQTRNITLNTALMSVTPYDASSPGTGSILDQFEDLLYVASGNWFGRSGNTEGFLRLFEPYPTAMDSTHNAALATLYPTTGNSTSPSPNSDSNLDASSVPNTGSSLYGGYSRLMTDKVYYVWPTGISRPRPPASVIKFNVTLQLMEVQDAVKI